MTTLDYFSLAAAGACAMGAYGMWSIRHTWNDQPFRFFLFMVNAVLGVLNLALALT